MADLSKPDLDFITHHPLPQLSELRERLQRVESSLKSDSSTSDSLNPSPEPNSNPQQAIIALIEALQKHEVASRLHISASSLPLASELAKILKDLREPNEGTFDYDPYRQLSEHIISESPEHIIREAVLGLAAKTYTMLTTHPSTPHRSTSGANQSSKQTPHKYSTGGLESTSEPKDDIMRVLGDELRPSLRIDIPDFASAVFGQVPHLEKLTDTAFKICQEGDNIRYTKDAGWSGWPEKCEEPHVIDWLGKCMSHLTKSIQNQEGYVAQDRRVYSTPNKFILGSPIQRKMDTSVESFAEGVDGSSQDDPPHWDRILVVGELKSKPVEDNHEATFLELAQYAREVFRTQDRRFVLCFTLCGSILRLWQFDRLGSSGSTSFDINKDGHRFVRVMLGYYLMSEEQLGFDPTIRRKNGKRWIEITRNGSTECLFIEEEVRKHPAIIGRATSCWKAYKDEGDVRTRLVVKDSWQYEERGEEGELIRDATVQSVTNIAKYYHHETIQCSDKDDDILGNVRKGMMKRCGRRAFRERSNTQPSAFKDRGKTASIQSKSGSKLRKRLSSSPSPSPSSKRPRTSLSKSPLEPIEHNRVHRRVVTYSPGKPLNEASTCLNIVTAFIGAITGHRSLLLKAGILHRDISIGNILLTETEDDGFLIDLDLAIRVKGHEPSGAPSRTGTKVFMSIGALLGDQHTFMHDLESFFWVFFWICIHYESPDEHGKMRERKTDFEERNYENPERLAGTKMGRISSKMFALVYPKVTKFCAPLLSCLKELHGVVFPGDTPKADEDENLYEEMIQVFKKAKSDLLQAAA